MTVNNQHNSDAGSSDSRLAAIEKRLKQLSPSTLEIIDESHLHAGHVGAKSGKGHFRVKIRSDIFAGLRPIQQHQKIYQSLGDLMETDIHALSIDAGVD